MTYLVRYVLISHTETSARELGLISRLHPNSARPAQIVKVKLPLECTLHTTN